MRCFERWFRRTGLPLKMSEGFHPKPRMAFPAALAVGIEGIEELMEVELTEARSAEWLVQRLAEHAPPGLKVNSLEVLPPGAKKARLRSCSYRIPIPPEHAPGLPGRIDRLWSSPSWPLWRPNRPAPLDLRAWLEDLRFGEGVLQMRLRVGSEASAGPRDVLAALELSGLEREGVWLSRTAVELDP